MYVVYHPYLCKPVSSPCAWCLPADAYSALVIATELAKVFKTDVNSLPLSLDLSWFEQKAVAVLLTLLHLGVRNIRLGPRLPAFLTADAVKVRAGAGRFCAYSRLRAAHCWIRLTRHLRFEQSMVYRTRTFFRSARSCRDALIQAEHRLPRARLLPYGLRLCPPPPPQVLVDKFNLMPADEAHPEADVKAMLTHA